jgi:hypothetical protein
MTGPRSHGGGAGYRLEPVALDRSWDALVEQSPQGTLYAQSRFRTALTGHRSAALVCLKGHRPVALLMLTLSDDGRDATGHELVAYDGLMLLPPPPGQGPAHHHSEAFRITEFVVARLADLYRDVTLRLHPALSDIRPFLWHGYGGTAPMFELSLRYTSVVTLTGLAANLPPEACPCHQAASKSRRQQIRYGLDQGVTTVRRDDPALFAGLYHATFARQGKPVPGGDPDAVTGLLTRLFTNGCARMYLSRTAEGQPGSAAVIGLDGKRAYYLFGANAPDLRHTPTGTMVLWHAFQDLAAEGVPEIDLIGVNSPLRGHFKLSFGGTLIPYWHLALRR